MRIHADRGPGIVVVRERTRRTLDTVPVLEAPVTPDTQAHDGQTRRERMKTLQDVQTWQGQTAYDSDGDKIGKVEDIYLDRQSGEPEWATVKTGLFGTKVSFVPIGDADTTDGGVRVPFTKDQVKDAPHFDADGELSPDEERRLYQHYGRSDYEWSGEDRTEGTMGRDRDARFDRDATSGGGAPVGRDISGPTTDDAMTRSEEELRVGKAS